MSILQRLGRWFFGWQYVRLRPAGRVYRVRHKRDGMAFVVSGSGEVLEIGDLEHQYDFAIVE